MFRKLIVALVMVILLLGSTTAEMEKKWIPMEIE